tara:strand:+ start:414 stop:1352 length:939 start_codon:yes stop_codon:yes gene_type:complete
MGFDINNFRAAGPQGPETTATVRVVDAENDQPEFMYVGGGAINRLWNLPILQVDGNDQYTEPGLVSYTYNWPAGWFFFSLPLDIATIETIEYNGTTLNITDADRTMQYHGYNQFGGTYKTTSASTHQTYVDTGTYTCFAEKSIALDKFLELLANDGKVIIAKDYLGAAYLPEFNFNGVGLLDPNWGYQLKLTHPCTMTITGKPYFTADENSNTITFGRIIYATSGWSLLSFPMINFDPENTSLQTGTDMFVPGEDFLEAQTAAGSLIIAKDFLGAAYLPQWNFNGIGNFFSGEAYQVKLQNINQVHLVDCTY